MSCVDGRVTNCYAVAVTFTRDFSDNRVVALPNSADLAIARLVCPSACRSLFAVINRWMIPTAFLIDCPVCLSYVNDPLFSTRSFRCHSMLFRWRGVYCDRLHEFAIADIAPHFPDLFAQLASSLGPLFSNFLSRGLSFSAKFSLTMNSKNSKNEYVISPACR